MRTTEAIAPHEAIVDPATGTDDSFLAAVQGIYASATSDAPWETCLERLAVLFGAANCSIEVIDKLGSDASSIALGPFSASPSGNASADCRERLFRFLKRQFIRTDSPPVIHTGLEPGHTGSGRSCVHRIAGRNLLVATVYCDARHQALFAVQWPMPGHEPEDSDVQMFLRLLPHLRQALGIRARLIEVRDRSSQAIEGLECLNEGTVTIDPGGNVLHASRVARKIADQHDGIGIFNGRLAFSASDSTSQYRRALTDLWCEGTDRTDVSVHRFCVRRPSGRRPFLVLMRRASRRDGEDGSVWPATAMVFVRDPDHCGLLDTQLLGESYDLSPAEINLAAALDSGSTPREISDERHVSITTVRSQLYTLMAKLDVNRQTDLIRLVANYRR